jgi:multidrug efflux system outer membrane protein
MKYWLALAAFFLVGEIGAKAGAVGPDYKRPASNLPQTFVETNSPAAQWKLAEPAADRARGSWWEIFGDDQLNRLETDTSQSNFAVAAAVARLAQARASADVARADFWPSLDLAGNATRTRPSEHRASADGVRSRVTHMFNDISTSLSLGWELDLWGRIRRSNQAAIAQLRSSADDLASLQLLTEAETASDYFTLRALDSDLGLLRSNLVAQTRALDLVRNRQRGGLATDLDVAQAETRVRQTEAQIPASELSREKLEHALSTLTGKPVSDLSIPTTLLTTEPPVVAAGIPSELLERRPDVASAEQRMIAANAGIGVAKAAFFPTFRFGGLAGFDSADASLAYNWHSRFWAIGPTLTMPIFESTRLTGRLRAARAANDEALASYRETVLRAIQDVEDNLAAQRLLAIQQKAEESVTASANRALAISLNRYQTGLTTYLDVVTALTTVLDAERNVAQLRGQRHLTTIALIKALGGGWDAASTEIVGAKPKPMTYNPSRPGSRAP